MHGVSDHADPACAIPWETAPSEFAADDDTPIRVSSPLLTATAIPRVFARCDERTVAVEAPLVLSSARADKLFVCVVERGGRAQVAIGFRGERDGVALPDTAITRTVAENLISAAIAADERNAVARAGSN